MNWDWPPRFLGKRVLPVYQYAVLLYLIPFVLILLFIIDSFLFNLTKLLFLVLFFPCAMICGLVGIGLTISGLIDSTERNGIQNKDIGYASLLGGMLIASIGILGLALGFSIR